jgi:hypothetical protein
MKMRYTELDILKRTCDFKIMMKCFLFQLLFLFISVLSSAQTKTHGYVNIFFDDFNRNNLGNEYGHTGWPDNVACMDMQDSNYLLKEGYLWLKTEYAKNTACNDATVKDFVFQSVYTRRSYKYGRFTLRTKVPGNKGLWPAYWMFGRSSDTLSKHNEIDIFEMETNSRRSKSQIWLFDKNGKRINHSRKWYSWWQWKPDQWSVYTLDWTSEGLKIYYDGGKVADLKNTFGHAQMMVLLSFGPCLPDISPWTCDTPVISEFPLYMPVDYLCIDFPIDTSAEVRIPGYSSLDAENNAFTGKRIVIPSEHDTALIKGGLYSWSYGSNLDLVATKSILLKQGFHAQQGSHFRAWTVDSAAYVKSGNDSIKVFRKTR